MTTYQGKFVSVTPEILLDNLPAMGAGGLGVLEADKLYTATKYGIDYTVITLLYNGGYAEQETAPGSAARKAMEQIESLKGTALVPKQDITVDMGKLGLALARPWTMQMNTAKVVFLEPRFPSGVVNACYKLYSGEPDEMLKYAFMGKAAGKYITDRIGADSIEKIDLQESLSAFTVLALPKELLSRTRFVTHTPGPWGHPQVSKDLLENVFNYVVIGKEEISLTELALKYTSEAFAVSRKHREVTARYFPQYKEKIGYVTNGVDLERWTNADILGIIPDGNIDSVRIGEFKRAHETAREKLVTMLKDCKPGLAVRDDTAIIAWNRRTAEYKRPFFAVQLIEDVGKDMNAVFVLSGKAHTRDGYSQVYLNQFKELDRKYRNVVFVQDYSVPKSKIIVAGSDMALLTPRPPMEASATSLEKFGGNGVPTMASRDGAALELIIHDKNGWLFGREQMECTKDPNTIKAIDDEDYASPSGLRNTFSGVMRRRNSEPEWYLGIMLEAMKTYRKQADMANALEKYGIINRELSVARELNVLVPSLRSEPARRLKTG